MKKYFNEKHESVINVRFLPKVENPKDGDVIPHSQIVNDVTFFQSAEDGKFHKVWMSRDMILDLASQITEIQSTTIESSFYSDLPF